MTSCKLQNMHQIIAFCSFLSVLIVLGFTSCNKQDQNNDKNNANSTDNKTKSLQYLVYQTDSNGELQKVSKDCSTLENISTLSGKAALFVRADGKKYQNALVQFTKTKNTVEFSGDRSKKLAGIYLRMDQAKQFLLDKGFTKAENYKAKLIYPFSLAGEEVGVLYKIAYSTKLDAIAIPLMTDNNLKEPALSKGLSMQAYFHALMAHSFPDQSRNSTDKKNIQEKHNTWSVVIYGFALYFGAATLGNIDYLEALGATTKWTPYNPPQLKKEMFLPLTNLASNEFNPLPYSANIAHCLWQARTSLGLEHQKYFDKELIDYLMRDDTTLTDKDGIILPVFLNNLSRRMTPTPRNQFCPCIFKQLNHAAKYVGACAYASEKLIDKESRETKAK